MQRFRFSWHKQSVMNFQTSDDPSPADLVADDEVLRRLRREPALIEVLWTKYAQRVFRYLSRRVGHAAAEDLLSDVFIAALDARSRVVAHDSGSALPWLYGIAHNIVRHHLRTLSTDHPIPPAETAGLDWASVDARLDAQSQRGQLRTALSALSEVERELFLLVAWEGLTPAKAAKILGITGLAARSRLHRARRRAQQAFSSAPGEPSPRTLFVNETKEP